jgi:hypothetical protein
MRRTFIRVLDYPMLDRPDATVSASSSEERLRRPAAPAE